VLKVIESVLQLTRKADYGLALMLDVATAGGSFVTTRTVSRRQKIPYPFLRQTATALAASGRRLTSRQPHGGVRPAPPASAISLLDIANVFGGVALNACTAVPVRCAHDGESIISPRVSTLTPPESHNHRRKVYVS
jgi:DNA-binding IscR family transcriptional regulator